MKSMIAFGVLSVAALSLAVARPVFSPSPATSRAPGSCCCGDCSCADCSCGQDCAACCKGGCASCCGKDCGSCCGGDCKGCCSGGSCAGACCH